MASAVQSYMILDYSEHFLSPNECEIELELPYPITAPAEDKDDAIRHYMEVLEKYLTLFSSTVATLSEAEITKMLNQSFTGPSVNVAQKVLELYNHERVDAPYITTINPFFLTGCLDWFTLNNSLYLARVQNNKILFTEIDNNPLDLPLNLSYSPHEITGVQAVSNNDSTAAFLTIIEKRCVKLIQFNDLHSTAAIKWKKKFTYSVLFAQYSLPTNSLGVILSNNTFYLYDVGKNDRLALGETNTKNVRRFCFNGKQLVLQYPSKIEIVNLDSLKVQQSIEPPLRKNDEIVNFKQVDSILYLVTKRYLFRVDLNKPDEMQHGTHLMKTCPCYVDFLQMDDFCFLCLTSQSGESVLFAGSTQIDSLPRLVPTIGETLTKCQLQRDLLLIHGLDKRLIRSTSGLKLLFDDNCLAIYTINDLGEVFKQRIGSGLAMDNRPIDLLFEWIKKLPAKQKDCLNVTNICDATHVKFLLNKPVVGCEVARLKKVPKRNKFKARFYDKYHTKNLEALAQTFAAVWEEDDDDDTNSIDEVVPKVKSVDKVSSWIQSHAFNGDLEEF